MSQQQLQRIQGWSAELQAMMTEMAKLQAELSDASGVPRKVLDNLGSAYQVLSDASGLLRSTTFALDDSGGGSDGETWAAAISRSIGKNYGDTA